MKLFSGHLLVIAVFLLARDAAPLIDVFVRGRSAQLRALPEPTTTRRGAKIWRVVRLLVIAELVLFPVVQQLGSKLYQALHAPPPHALEGVYQVEVFVRDGREVPTSAAEAERWDLFIMDPSGRPKVRRGDGSFETFWSYPVAADVSTVELRRVIDEATKEHVAVGELRLQESGGRVLVEGELDGVAVRAELAPSARRFALAEATIRLRQGG